MSDRKITIYPSMILKDEAKATKCKCPFNMGDNRSNRCVTNSCMAWVEVLGETSREDHSGGAQMMYDEARFRGVEIERKGPGGSMGHIDVPAVGFCKRLWKEIQYV